MQTKLVVWALIGVSSLSIVACSKNPDVAKAEYLKSGDGYVAQKKYREAAIQYRNAIAVDPRFGEARLKLANVYEQLNEPQNAYGEYIRAADLLPQNVDAQLKAGAILLAGGKYEEAKARADKALTVDPKNVNARVLKGSALAGLRDLEGAIGQVENAIRTDPSQSVAYTTLGGLQFVKGNREAAEKAFRQAVEADPKSVPAHMALAHFYWASGRPNETEAALKETLKLDEKNLLTNRALAIFYLVSGRPAEAEPWLKVVAENSPGFQGRLTLADYYLSSNRPADAKAVLEKIGTEKDAFVPSTLRLAAVATATGDRQGAYRFLDQILTKEPKQVDALLAKGQMQFTDGKLDDALASANAGANAAQNNPNAHFLRGRILSSKYDVPGAIQAQKEAVRLNPKFIGAILELGRLSLAAGRPEEAAQYAQNALELAPNLPEAQLLLARTELVRRNPQAAEDALRTVSNKYSQSPVVLAEMGQVLIAKNNRAAARAAFEQALAKDPLQLRALEGLTYLDLQDKNVKSARTRLESLMVTAPKNDALRLVAARMYVSAGDLDAAERVLKEAISLNSNNLQAFGALGMLYARQQRLGDATAEFEKLAQRQPHDVGPLTVVGMLLHMQNRVEDARARYEKVLSMDARAAVAANNLAWIYAERGEQLDRALQLAQTAKAQLPESPEVNDTLGWVYYKKGLGSLAVAPLQQSVEQDPKNPTYHYHLGLVYANSGQRAKAREALEQALKLNLPAAESADARKALASLKS